MEYVALCGDEFKWVYWNSIYNFRDSRLIRTETFDLVLYVAIILYDLELAPAKAVSTVLAQKSTRLHFPITNTTY